MGDGDDLLFLALVLRDEDVDDDEAVRQLLDESKGSTAELRAAYERAWALNRSAPTDERAHRLVEMITRALQLAVEREVADATQLAEFSPVFRGTPVERPKPPRKVGPRTLSDRLAQARQEPRQVIDIDRLSADLDRLRASAAPDGKGRRRRG